MFKKLSLLLSILLIFQSCDNISDSAGSDTNNARESSKLKALSYKLKKGNVFKDGSASALMFEKALNIHISNAHYIDLYDINKTFKDKFSFIDFMYLVEGSTDSNHMTFPKYLEFKNVKLGQLELKGQGSYWLDSTKAGYPNPPFNFYSWFQPHGATGFPDELKESASPLFSAEYNSKQINHRLKSLPKFNTTFKNIDITTTVDLNNDFRLEFNRALPKGTFVGFQVLPIFTNSTDSTNFVNGNQVYNLYIELELKESSDNVTFTKNMLSRIKSEISDASKVIADVFVFSYSKHDEILIDSSKEYKANVILNTSSVVSVKLSK